VAFVSEAGPTGFGLYNELVAGGYPCLVMAPSMVPLIVLGEEQLRRILREYFSYYHEVRPHQSLEKNSSLRRQIELPTRGRVISIPQHWRPASSLPASGIRPAG
jgi:hypothetical protein